MQYFTIYNGNTNREWGGTRDLPAVWNTEEEAQYFLDHHWDLFPGDPHEVYIETNEDPED